MTRLSAWPVEGWGEVSADDDLVGMLTGAGLADGDVLVVTSKVVSKAEGRVVDSADRKAVVAGETERVLARRGETSIVRTAHGLVLAAAGVDTSNVASGSLVLLPRDPDASARRLRSGVRLRHGVNVGVLVTDTAGRAWRLGQTDIAIGAAGVRVLDDHVGKADAYGNPLAVTQPAVADELAAAADLVKGKLGGTPVAVVRGLPHLVLPAGDDGAGARSLVRPDDEDMFGLGSREAVARAVAAVTGRGHEHPAGFGAALSATELHGLLADCLDAGCRLVRGPGEVVDVAWDEGEVSGGDTGRACSSGCWRSRRAGAVIATRGGRACG